MADLSKVQKREKGNKKERKREKQGKQTQKESRITKSLLLLNPGNLSKEVYNYGYHFSWKTHLFVIGVCIAGMGTIGLLFQLRWNLLVIVLIAMFLSIPVFILDTYKKMYEQKRFADVAAYMEQMLYAFQKTGKVLSALKETRETFESGHMRDVVDKAVNHLEEGHSKTGKSVLRESLDTVENEYECRKMKTVHDFLISAEEYGGDAVESIELLLNDIELWKRRGYLLQKEKKEAHADNIVSIVVTTVFCALILYALNSIPGMFKMQAPYNVFKAGLVQITSFALLLWMVFSYAKSEKSLTRNWLTEENGKREERVLRDYYDVVNYDEKKEKKRSLMWTLPFLVLTVFFVIKGSWVAVPMAILAVVMTQQHRFDRSIARNNVSEELYSAFPEWLMQMALLMQHSNVQVSIAKSVDEAPKILVPELNALMNRIKEKPKVLSSYTDFCKDFDIPEAASCMKMLYAISESGTGDARVQIQNLLTQMQEMQSHAAELKNENSVFKVQILYRYPIMGASVKMLGDLVVGMAFLLEMLSNMGGA
jgi:hypothetical protein